jgi:hypothetical protein
MFNFLSVFIITMNTEALIFIYLFQYKVLTSSQFEYLSTNREQLYVTLIFVYCTRRIQHSHIHPVYLNEALPKK